MRPAELADLPPTLDTSAAAELFGVSTDHLWALAREGRAPVEPLRLGRTLRWPTAKVLAVLGIEPDGRDGARAMSPGPSATTYGLSARKDRRWGA